VVAEEDFQAVVSGAVVGVRSSNLRSWLQLLPFVYHSFHRGSSICTSLTTKGTKVHKGKTPELKSHAASRQPSISHACRGEKWARGFAFGGGLQSEHQVSPGRRASNKVIRLGSPIHVRKPQQSSAFLLWQQIE
jgi:hypothetical protein